MDENPAAESDARAARLAAAYDAFLAEMAALGDERRALVERVTARMEKARIDELRNETEAL